MKRYDAALVATAAAAVGLLDSKACAKFLSISPRKLADLLREGLPVIDLGAHDVRLRRKRLLRFDPSEVLEWCRARGRAGGNGNEHGG